jgi:trans-2,3-dihydro-3-hydroxyanthranilate isomerase
VRFEPGKNGTEAVWFLAPPAELGPACERDAIAASLGISPEDIDDASPVQMLSAGISVLIVPIRSLEALKRSRLDLAAHAPLSAAGFPSLVYLFTRETHDGQNDLCVRFFFEAHGVREDPATGNGAAFLGHYLLEHGLFGSELSLRIEQGHEVRRPSRVLLRARQDGDAREVSVGGQVIPVVKGALL